MIRWLHQGTAAHSIRRATWEHYATHCGLLLPATTPTTTDLKTWSVACEACARERRKVGE